MRPKAAALLWDMIDYAQYILTKAEALTLSDYETNRDARLAIERAFHNIGEAARRLAPYDPDVAMRITALPAMVAFRNVLAHNYDEIDNARVWAVITTHLPILIEEATNLVPDEPSE